MGRPRDERGGEAVLPPAWRGAPDRVDEVLVAGRALARRTAVDVLLAQLAPGTHDVAANVREACQLVAEHHVPIVAELYLQLYALRGIEPVDAAAAGGALAALRDCAGRHATALIVGTAIRETAGSPPMANAVLCIDEPGELAAIYRKVHFFGAERRFFSSGGEYVVVTLAGVAVGLLVCYDLDFPEAARAAAAGAELLATVSANMDPCAHDNALYARTRAVENRVPHVYVNAVGQEGRVRFFGGSTVVDVAGSPVAELGGDEHAVRIVTVPQRLEPGDPRPTYLAERRPRVPVRVVSPLRH